MMLRSRLSSATSALIPRIAAPSLSRPYSSLSEDLVLVEKDDKEPIITLRFNRPDKLNAMTEDLGVRLEERVDEIVRGTHGEVRAVVLTGAGRAFSAGGDFKFLTARTESTPEENSVEMKKFYKRFMSIRNIKVPVIAAINGPAIGAGLCVALLADMRVAARSAKLGLTFTGLGLHPGMGATFYLPKLVGMERATMLLMTNRVMDGNDAHRLGVVCDVAQDDDAHAMAMDIATSIAAASPLAVRTCLSTLREQQEEGLHRALTREADAQAACYAHPDLLEGMRAVTEKTPPKWTSGQ